MQQFVEAKQEKKERNASEGQNDSEQKAQKEVEEVFSNQEIPMEVYTRQLRRMISEHLDRAQAPRESSPQRTKLQTRKYEVSAFIQEYSAKEQQFLNYCENLLGVVDEKTIMNPSTDENVR